MSSSGSNGAGGGGPDFDLPEEILSVIPADPYDQLDLARKITSMAIASRVSKLESDTSRLRQKLYEKDRLVFDLEEKVLRLERSHQEADSRLKMSQDNQDQANQAQAGQAQAIKPIKPKFTKAQAQDVIRQFDGG